MRVAICDDSDKRFYCDDIGVYIVEMELWRACLIVHDMLLLIHRVILSNLGGQKRPILPENGIFGQL